MHPLRILFVVLCVALVYYTATHTSQQSENTTENTITLRDSEKLSNNLEDSSPTSASEAEQVVDANLMQHDYAHLKDFILPEIHFGNMPIQQAVASLITHYNKVCSTTGEAPLQFETEFNGKSLGNVDMTIAGSFQHILRRISLVSGMELDQNRSKLHFHAIEPQQQIVSEIIDVPAEFEYRVGLSIDEHECFELVEQESSVNEHLKKLMHLSPEAIVSYNAHASKLKVTSTESDIYRINKLVYLTELEPVVRIHTNTRMFTAPVDMDIPTNEVLSNDDVEQVLVKASDVNGFEQSETPLLISMNGERSTIEQTKEVVAIDEADGSLYYDWTGYRITTSSDLLGFGVQSYVRVENNIPIPNSQKLAFHDKEVEHFLLPSENVIIKTHEENGKAHYLSVTKSINGITAREGLASK